MGHKLAPSDRSLYQAVDEVLQYVWDPIGVAGVPQARDEYTGYALQILGMLRGGADAGAIAKYLSEVTVEAMGLSSALDHDLKVAEVLVRWREVIDAQEV